MTDDDIAYFEHMPQAVAAQLFGVDRTTLRRWEVEYNCPRNSDGTYSFHALFWFCVCKRLPDHHAADNARRRVRTRR